MADVARDGGAHASPNNETNDRNDIARPNSRNMMISHNLVAALEFDEQARASIDNPPPAGPSNLPLFVRDPPVAGVGLPPPPRPKSSSGSVRKVRSPPTSPPMSPATPLLAIADNTVPPKVYPQSTTSSKASAASHSNPYINPPPRLPLLRTDEGLYRAHSRSPSLPERLASRSPESVRTSESPQSEEHASPLQMSSPESATASSASTEGRTGFQKHMRLFSALPGVDKILVKGKARMVGRSIDAKARASRRASDAELHGCDPQGKTRDAQPMMRQFFKSLDRGKSGSVDDGSRSAPASPVEGARHARHKISALTDRGEMEIENESSDAEFRRRHQARQSSPSLASSESSHEPPSTPNDPRISISSTVYQASHCSIQYSPLFTTNSPLYPPQSGRPTMHSDSESFMDLASPTFSPRSPEFSTNASFASLGEPAPYQRDSAVPDTSRTSHHHATRPSLPAITTATAVAKPPIPTTPKPSFSSKRSKSAQPPPNRSAAPGNDSPVGQDVAYPSTLPPTTNFLNPQERAERVRKARKITQLLGQPPPAPVHAATLSQLSYEANAPGGFLTASSNFMSNITGKKKHQRGAVSMSVTPVEYDSSSRAAPDTIKYPSLASRRHSSPLSPQTFSFVEDETAEDATSDVGSSRHSSVVIEIGSQQGTPYSDWSSHAGHDGGAAPDSPTSFMDFTEEDVVNDAASSIITIETPKTTRRPLLSSKASVYSFTSEELEEEERRRKREKLAKLHRFLGSRVPADLVLNQLSVDTAVSLPPIASAAPVSAVEQQTTTTKMDSETRKVWLRRRRSSSAAELGGKWSEEIDRLKEELNDREKAQNVRRAVKMEKMFGVQPPQTLYHTRSAPSHAEVQNSTGAPSTLRQSTIPSSPSSPRNVNQTAYSNRSKPKRGGQRPGTAESTEPLIDRYEQPPHPFSDIYEHYRHSLNSLNDIMDRDDTASLRRLHTIIHGDAEPEEPALQHFTRQDSDEEPSTPKAERRRSLPSRTSMTSISSAYSIAPPSAEEALFQARRKRAAKLTQFFGVNYRDLMNEILDSLEKGLEEERGRGTLRPDEVQELLQKLRKLKIKRNSSFTLTTS